MAYGEAPQGSPVLYQLHQQPSVADSPPQKRSYKQTKPSVETADSSDDSDNLRLQASFPPLPLSYPQIRNLEEDEKEWLVDINAAQALQKRVLGTRQEVMSGCLCTNVFSLLQTLGKCFPFLPHSDCFADDLSV